MKDYDIKLKIIDTLVATDAISLELAAKLADQIYEEVVKPSIEDVKEEMVRLMYVDAGTQ